MRTPIQERIVLFRRGLPRPINLAIERIVQLIENEKESAIDARLIGQVRHRGLKELHARRDTPYLENMRVVECGEKVRLNGQICNATGEFSPFGQDGGFQKFDAVILLVFLLLGGGFGVERPDAVVDDLTFGTVQAEFAAVLAAVGGIVMDVLEHLLRVAKAAGGDGPNAAAATMDRS